MRASRLFFATALLAAAASLVLADCSYTRFETHDTSNACSRALKTALANKQLQTSIIGKTKGDTTIAYTSDYGDTVFSFFGVYLFRLYSNPISLSPSPFSFSVSLIILQARLLQTSHLTSLNRSKPLRRTRALWPACTSDAFDTYIYLVDTSFNTHTPHNPPSAPGYNSKPPTMRSTLIMLLLASAATLVSSTSRMCDWGGRPSGSAQECDDFCKNCCAKYPSDSECGPDSSCIGDCRGEATAHWA
ncbi:hypothetical protein C8R44DRAFT_869555 [Mycena epipterygia]|nr:hypothetical protein C8R44DRAFT_869555 [Mycena epipterygia]